MNRASELNAEKHLESQMSLFQVSLFFSHTQAMSSSLLPLVWEQN